MRRLLLVGLLLCAGLGCDRKVEKWVDASDEPAPVEHPVRVPGLERPVARARMPALEPDAAPLADTRAAATTETAPIRGTLRLAKGVRVPEGGIVFVIARSIQGGPPLAALRLPLGGFPMSFEIGPRDVMVQGRPFAGPITLSARIDPDGDPLTREPEAPSATYPEPLEPGASGVELLLAPQG